MSAHYRFPPETPSIYRNTPTYFNSSPVEMTSQNSDSGYGSEIPSPESPRGRYPPATRNDFYDEPSQPSSSTKKKKSPKSKAAYTCLFPGCEASFTRSFDLSRHQRTTHGVGVRIDCPEGWCGRSGQPEGREKGGFSRSDHFCEHVKKVHRKEVVKDSRGTMWVKSSDGRMCQVHASGPSS